MKTAEGTTWASRAAESADFATQLRPGLKAAPQPPGAEQLGGSSRVRGAARRLQSATREAKAMHCGATNTAVPKASLVPKTSLVPKASLVAQGLCRGSALGQDTGSVAVALGSVAPPRWGTYNHAGPQSATARGTPGTSGRPAGWHRALVEQQAILGVAVVSVSVTK